MMKKLLTITILAVSLLSLVGCENELEEKFLNPEKSTEASLPNFFTAILNNDRIRPSYGNIRTFLLKHSSVYSQTAYYTNGEGMYQENDTYTGRYWTEFYVPSNDVGGGVLGMFRSMEVAYEALSDEDKAKQEIFMQAARIVLYDQASQMVDLWGDIPYTEAGSLQTSSTINNPEFNEQVTLYNTFLSGLKTCADFFATASADPSFSKADILLSGNVNKWRRYANSLRLRLLMRTSNVNESGVQTQVLEILNNSATYPLVDGGNSGNYSPESSDILLHRLSDYNNNLNSALTEVSGHYAPDYMLNSVLLPANDPRIPVLFDKFGRTQKIDGKDVFVPNPNYGAMSITLTSEEASKQFASYSIVDSTTFLQNPMLPGILMTASEVNFLKAEAYERWGSSTDAQAAYETALKQSVTFYYYLQELNTIKGMKKTPKPADADVNTFVTTSTAAYAGSPEEKLALIWTQKWVHFGILQSNHAWSEYRRTNYPQLTFVPAGLAGFEAPPARLPYPSVETAYNKANYELVRSEDTRTTKIFWDVN